MTQGSGRAVGREGYLFLAAGVVLLAMTVGVLTTARLSRAESATPTPSASTGAIRAVPAAQPSSATKRRPVSALEVFNEARAVVGASPLTATPCAARAAAEYADSLPPVVPAAGSGWTDAAVWCDGRSMTFGFERGRDRTGVAMAAAEIAEPARSAQFTDVGSREFGAVVLSIGTTTDPVYVLAWSLG